jgi:hypothetical protein
LALTFLLLVTAAKVSGKGIHEGVVESLNRFQDSPDILYVCIHELFAIIIY